MPEGNDNEMYMTFLEHTDLAVIAFLDSFGWKSKRDGDVITIKAEEDDVELPLGKTLFLDPAAKTIRVGDAPVEFPPPREPSE